MQNNKHIILFFIIIVFAFSAGIVKLFSLRFEAGDIYPPYSSLRSDPIGSKALYESYKATGIVEIKRNYLSIKKLTKGNDTVLFFLGDTPGNTDFFPISLYEAITGFLSSGGRLVVAFSPISKNFHDEKADDEKKDKDKTIETPEKNIVTDGDDEKENEDTDNPEMVSLSDKWGFSYNYESDKDSLKKGASSLIKELENTLSWHSIMSLGPLSPEWRVIYQINGKPVIVERDLGAGSIVFCTDSYSMSNEALMKEKSPRFLAWLTGGSTNIIFDESHLGIQKNPGIANLIRKYNLHGFIVALIVFSILFIWKNGSHFVPPVEQNNIYSGGQVSARDSSSGLTSLLRKNIGKRQVLDVCVSEWKKSFISDNEASKNNEKTLKQIQLMVKSGEETSKEKLDPVEGYAKVCRIVSVASKPL